MEIRDKEIVMRKSDNSIRTNITPNGEYISVIPSDTLYNAVKSIYDKMVGQPQITKEQILDGLDLNALWSGTVSAATESAPTPPEEIVKSAIARMIKFFSEFDFQPNFRFLNTLSRYGKKGAKGYICRYFELVNSPYAAPICDKVNSKEFDMILKDFFTMTTQNKVNKRFKLYYGAQGTGKTTQGLKESGGKCIICNNAMLPNDLMEDFTFDNGKAAFHPSALCLAMQNGTSIVLDEINLLPFESLRFLQGILDDKASFDYKGQTINIVDGFKVIGTMNLRVNGMAYGLPEPLVDRCEETQKFELTADNLIGAII